MTADQELERLRRAIIEWATAPDYAEGCRRWSRVARLVGIDSKDADR